jgi:signal transduction histidine kinase
MATRLWPRRRCPCEVEEEQRRGRAFVLVATVTEVERLFRRGLAAFRWGAWVWIAVVLALYWDDDYFIHRNAAAGLIAAALLFTVLQTALLPLSIRFENRRRVAVAELALGFCIMALDGYVRRDGIIFENGPTLGSWWPVIGLFSFATYAPLWGAAIGGLSFGVARWLAVWWNGTPPSEMSDGEWLSVTGTGLFAGLAAYSVAYILRLLRNAEDELALARAREEVARTLHDGVLQTLAVVERRSGDETLSQMAREQERELRKYLFEQRAETQEQEELGSALMKAASRFEQAFGGRVNVIVAEDLPPMTPKRTHGLAAAAGEALMNAGKHGQAKVVTVYVEPTDRNGVFCSVNDDGSGFDTDAVVPRIGLSQSIRGRIEELGGRVEIRSSPGNGTEVLMWLE